MSKIPKEATTRNPRSKKINARSDIILTKKPLCDCNLCMCRSCPDILQLLAITVTDSTCKFDSKMKPYDKQDIQSSAPAPSDLKSLLNVVNQNRGCNCGVVARGVRDDVHKNFSTSKRQDIADTLEASDTQAKTDLLQTSKVSSSTDSNHKSISITDSKTTSDFTDCQTPKLARCSICDNILQPE